jgi:hypothetical protein
LKKGSQRLTLRIGRLYKDDAFQPVATIAYLAVPVPRLFFARDHGQVSYPQICGTRDF